MKVTRVNINSVSLIKRTFFFILSWFFPTKRFKKKMHSNLSNLSKFKPHKNQKCAKRSIESALLSSTAGQGHSALSIRPRIYISIRNKEKCIERRSNFVISGKKIMNVLWILEFGCISIYQVQLHTKRFETRRNNNYSKQGEMYR